MYLCATSIRGKTMDTIKHKKIKSIHQDYAIPEIKIILSNLYKLLQCAAIENKILNRNKKYIIAVNYHSVPIETVANFECQVRAFYNTYENVNRSKLGSFLSGDWPYEKPGIMLHFDDGLCEHYEVVAPILDRYDFTGWYHIITDNVDRHRAMHEKDPLTWEQIINLARRGHEICSHTCTHKRLNEKLSDEEIRYELCHSYERISHELGSEPIGFCYPGGEIESYDIRAIKLIKLIYKYAFPSYTKKINHNVSPYAINRSNIESSWPLSAVSLSIGFLWQLKHKKKANTYNKLLSINGF